MILAGEKILSYSRDHDIGTSGFKTGILHEIFSSVPVKCAWLDAL